MKTENIKNKFMELEEGIIKDYSFDMLYNTIFLSVGVIENGIEKEYSVLISNVSMYYYINNTEEKRKIMNIIEDNEYLECTTINTISKQTKIIFHCGEEDKWLNQYGANANLVIEIWNKLLVIEAQLIKINEMEFHLY